MDKSEVARIYGSKGRKLAVDTYRVSGSAGRDISIVSSKQSTRHLCKRECGQVKIPTSSSRDQVLPFQQTKSIPANSLSQEGMSAKDYKLK